MLKIRLLFEWPGDIQIGCLSYNWKHIWSRTQRLSWGWLETCKFHFIISVRIKTTKEISSEWFYWCTTEFSKLVKYADEQSVKKINILNQGQDRVKFYNVGFFTLLFRDVTHSVYGPKLTRTTHSWTDGSMSFQLADRWWFTALKVLVATKAGFLFM